MLKSPLRYPGGKGAFCSYFSTLIEKNNLLNGKYYEPFAGGAGLAISLLSTGKVSEVILNDADYHIYSFWRTVITKNDLFIKKIIETEISIKQWKKQKEIYTNYKKYPIFEVGFATFYLNRCNRSGILNAGPIGGYEQDGFWKINERYNKETLVNRIIELGILSSKITFKNMDGVDFMKKYLPIGNERKKVLVYIDPPYVKAGNDLYLNKFTSHEHKKLAHYLDNQLNLNWVLTYDNNLLIQQLYKSYNKLLFYLNYSLQNKRHGKEVFIYPNRLKLPKRNLIESSKWRIIKKIRSNNEN